MHFAPAVADHVYIVLVFDNRGIGQSTYSSDEDFGMQDMADDTIALIRHLGWKKVDLLGYSMVGLCAA